MTFAPSIQKLLGRLQAPQQDLAQLSFCGGSKDTHVNMWINGLPLTQINYVSTQLYKALPEIGRLKTTPEIRLAMFECLRSPAQQSIQGLSQTFLNQPLLLPEAARKSATVAQAIQKHMTNGYLVVVRELSQEKRLAGKEGTNLLALAIHRAMTGLGLSLLRNYQLYTPIPSQVWAELHALYQLAETLILLDLPVDDPLPKHRDVRTIEHAYLRILLLACARPNQLRQDEVIATYNALETLSPSGQLTPHNATRKDNLFAVMLDSNQPPLYKSRLPPGTGQSVRDLSSGQLATRLEEEVNLSASNTDASRNAYNLSAALTDHLIHAWNILAQRSFERSTSAGTLKVTIGLSNIHFHVAGSTPFPIFLDQANSINHGRDTGKIFQKRGVQLKTEKETEDDPWGDAFNVGASPLAGKQLPTLNIELNIRQQQQEYQGKHPIYDVPLLDASAGGYCLEWREAIPGQLKAGELLGLREEGRQKWALGVVRWVQRTRDSTQIGVQVLAPHAIPIGIAVVQKTGGFSEYLRALELPALKAVNQPATLLTNAISFREYDKVQVYYAGDRAQTEPTRQLTQKLFSTGAFCQFSFREAAGTKPTAADDFDAVWKK